MRDLVHRDKLSNMKSVSALTLTQLIASCRGFVHGENVCCSVLDSSFAHRLLINLLIVFLLCVSVYLLCISLFVSICLCAHLCVYISIQLSVYMCTYPP